MGKLEEAAERAILQDPNILSRTSSEAVTAHNKAVAAHAEIDVGDDFRLALGAELRGFRDRLDGASPAERMLVAIEAKAHFGKRVAEVEAKVKEHRERQFQRNNEARFGPMRARVREDAAALLAAPVRAVLRVLTAGLAEAEASLGTVASAADVAVVAEVFELKLKDAAAALRAVRNRKAA